MRRFQPFNLSVLRQRGDRGFGGLFEIEGQAGGRDADLAVVLGSEHRTQKTSIFNAERAVPPAHGTHPASRRPDLRIGAALAAPGGSVRVAAARELGKPQRLTVLAIASEAPTLVFCVPRIARAVQRRRPRIAAGSALVVAGAVARLRAAAAEPLR